MEKIKSFFDFIRRGWRAGIHGKLSVVFLLFSFLLIVRLFVGEVNFQRFIMNIWHLDAGQAKLVDEQAKLASINRHIKLIQDRSPDYIEEVAMKYLNIGDQRIKILR